MDGTAFNIIIIRYPQNPSGEPIIYALTITDFTALQNQLASDFALPEVMAEPEMQKKYDVMNNKGSDAFGSVQNNSGEMEKLFLKYFSNYGIALSKFDPISNKWNVLKLKNRYNPAHPTAPNSVIPTPCN